MTNDNTKNREYKVLTFLIATVAVLVCLKSIFIDFGFDQGYTVTMAYRHLRGDRMLMEMWDPLQTSMFATNALMFVYRLFVPSFTGVAIYLNLCGTLLLAFVGYLLYREIKDVAGKFVAFLAAVFFLVFRAKISPFPDYTNLCIIFSALAFVNVVKFFKSGEKFAFLFLTAVFLSLQVLVYPSMIMAYVGIVVTLIVYSKRKVANSLILTGLCALFGSLYAGYFAIRLGLNRFVKTLQFIVSGDAHGGDYEGQLDKFASIKSGVYFKKFLMLMLLAIMILAVLLLIKFLCKRIFKHDIGILPYYLSLLFMAEVLYMVFWQSKKIPEWCDFGYVIPLLLIIISAVNYKKMSEVQKRLWISGVIISVSTFLGACLFSNMPFLYVFPFMLVGGVASFAGVSNMKKAVPILVIALCMALFKTGFYVGGYAQIAGENTIRLINVHNRTLYGANAQLISTWSVSDSERQAYMEFPEYINPADKALYIGGWIYDPIMHVYMNAEVANPNTADTPFYGESLNRYYEMNPYKFPTVVVVEKANGSPAAGEDSWIMNWIREKGFILCGESEYWAYYR